MTNHPHSAHPDISALPQSEREAACHPTPSQPVPTLESLQGLMFHLLELVEGMAKPQGGVASGHSRPLRSVTTPVIPAPLTPTAPTLDSHWTTLGVVTNPKPNTPTTQPLWEVAKYLGDHYGTLAPWYHIVKRATQQGQLARLNVQNESRLTIDTICRFNRLLYEFGLATEAKYLKFPERRFLLTPNPHPHTMPFLLGGWLEDYVAHQVAVATGSLTQSRNVLVQLTPSHQVELDLVWYRPPVFSIFECKTHDYQASLPRLQLISQYLRPTHLYVVVLQRPAPEVCQQFAQAYGIQLLALQDVPRTLSQLHATHPNPQGDSAA